MKYISLIIFSLLTSCIYGQVYFIQSGLPQLDYKTIKGNNQSSDELITVKGHVLNENAINGISYAGVTLLLKIDGILYETKNVTMTDIDNIFMIMLPSYIYNDKKISKYLKIECLGCRSELIDVSQYNDSTLEILLKNQTAMYSTVNLKDDSYYVDLSLLRTNAGKLPSPRIGFFAFYTELCNMLTLDSSWKDIKSIRYLLDFDEKGNFINVDCNIENMNIINYFKRLAWSPAETLNGKKIPLQILLKIENVSGN